MSADADNLLRPRSRNAEIPRESSLEILLQVPDLTRPVKKIVPETSVISTDASSPMDHGVETLVDSTKASRLSFAKIGKALSHDDRGISPHWKSHLTTIGTIAAAIVTVTLVARAMKQEDFDGPGVPPINSASSQIAESMTPPADIDSVDQATGPVAQMAARDQFGGQHLASAQQSGAYGAQAASGFKPDAPDRFSTASTSMRPSEGSHFAPQRVPQIDPPSGYSMNSDGAPGHDDYVSAPGEYQTPQSLPSHGLPSSPSGNVDWDKTLQAVNQQPVPEVGRPTPASGGYLSPQSAPQSSVPNTAPVQGAPFTGSRYPSTNRPSLSEVTPAFESAAFKSVMDPTTRVTDASLEAKATERRVEATYFNNGGVIR